ncbi:hypothetical protein Goshw_028875 [Gossypium schwendimanii]|uniref:RNase H type-1 domain-containing protein n=1 Tax=Gossypium schwendimanii TaxID=34291 RepID=A0A7J9L681_GOSSC|nr:hypothetical protein [Gossypium schwendimanii]
MGGELAMASFLWVTNVLCSPKGRIQVVLDMWEARNLFVIQGRVSSLQDAILKAFPIHPDFWVHNLLYAPLLPRRLTVVRWTPPYEDEVKINVDVALNEEMRFAFCGVIVRDHEGMVLVGFSYSFTKAFDAPSAEALALACATQKAFKKGFSRVIFESDCAFIIIKFNSQTLDLSLYGCIVKEALGILQFF